MSISKKGDRYCASLGCGFCKRQVKAGVPGHYCTKPRPSSVAPTSTLPPAPWWGNTGNNLATSVIPPRPSLRRQRGATLTGGTEIPPPPPTGFPSGQPLVHPRIRALRAGPSASQQSAHRSPDQTTVENLWKRFNALTPPSSQ